MAPRHGAPRQESAGRLPVQCAGGDGSDARTGCAERSVLRHGGLLSHLHFQYASDDGMLLRADSTLRKRMWYPTMCAAEDTLRDQCDIVRTLHKLPPLDREA